MIEANKQIKEQASQSFKWQFSLNDKHFDCDPLLPPFLGFCNQSKISIGQLFSTFDSRQVAEIKRVFKEVLETKKNISTLVVINTPDNRYLVDLSINHIENKKNAVEGKICYLQHFPTPPQENELLREIFKNSTNGRMLTTSNHIILMVNEAFCKETGYQEHELIGKSAKILRSGRYNPEFYKKLWENVNTNKSWCGELLTKNKQQEVYAHEVQIQRFDLCDESHFYFTNSLKLDIPSSLLHTQIQGDNSHSNIPDKKKYTQKLQNCYKKLSSEQTIVVATFSIKWLQKISDFTACWLVSQRFHTAEQIGHLGLISKGIYSIYWVEDKNADKIDALLRKLLRTFTHGFDNGGFDLFSTVNIGASILSVDANNPAQLISHSTQTLIANPYMGHSSLYYFDRRLAKRFDRHQILAQLLKEALHQKNIEVYYQPIVELPTMKIKEFEALFRIKLKTDINYNTQELITIAEAYNWIDEIDAMVTKIALNALPRIQQHYNCNDIAIAINRSLANDRLTHCCLEDTINILLASNTDLSKVTIELTESAIFENFDQQKQWVEKLSEHGVKITIDDFGTGYSSFAYLNNSSIDFIKIDRTFITNLTLESNEYAMIEMLCKLAHKMGTKVIVEGVETAEEFTLLSDAKVDLLQGYIFSKPVSLETILATPPVPYSIKLANTVSRQEKASIADIRLKEFKTIAFDDRLAIVKEELKIKEHRYFLVTEHKKCRGILYSSDLHSALSPYLDTKGEQKRDLMTLDKRVHQIMKKEFISLHIDSPIELAEQFFLKEPHSIIVVINDGNECIGITTIQELLKYKLMKSHQIEDWSI